MPRWTGSISGWRPSLRSRCRCKCCVISRPAADKAVLDVGVKGAGSEFGVPAIRDFPDVEIPYFMSEEHVVVRNVPDWKIGQLVQLIPSHACTTCNLHREFVVHEARSRCRYLADRRLGKADVMMSNRLRPNVGKNLPLACEGTAMRRLLGVFVVGLLICGGCPLPSNRAKCARSVRGASCWSMIG